MKRILYFLTIFIILSVPANAQMFGSIFQHVQPVQIIPLVGEAVPDTTNADAADSLDVWREADYTLDAEYAKYLVFSGNGTASSKKATMTATWYPVHSYGDSLYFWLKASIADGDTNKVSVWIAYGDSSVLASSDSVVVTTANTWERKAIKLSSSITEEVYFIVVKAWCIGSEKIWISDIYLKRG